MANFRDLVKGENKEREEKLEKVTRKQEVQDFLNSIPFDNSSAITTNTTSIKTIKAYFSKSTNDLDVLKRLVKELASGKLTKTYIINMADEDRNYLYRSMFAKTLETVNAYNVPIVNVQGVFLKNLSDTLIKYKDTKAIITCATKTIWLSDHYVSQKDKMLSILDEHLDDYELINIKRPAKDFGVVEYYQLFSNKQAVQEYFENLKGE